MSESLRVREIVCFNLMFMEELLEFFEVFEEDRSSDLAFGMYHRFARKPCATRFQVLVSYLHALASFQNCFQPALLQHQNSVTFTRLLSRRLRNRHSVTFVRLLPCRYHTNQSAKIILKTLSAVERMVMYLRDVLAVLEQVAAAHFILQHRLIEIQICDMRSQCLSWCRSLIDFHLKNKW